MQWRDRDDERVGTSEPGPPSDSWIVQECEAFLGGRYRELLEVRRASVPAWAWINVLAHGDTDEVRRRAASCAGEQDGDAYVARLARHTLVKMRKEGVSLHDVQQTVLVPLELALAATLGEATAEQTTLSRAVARELLRGVEPLRVDQDGT